PTVRAGPELLEVSLDGRESFEQGRLGEHRLFGRFHRENLGDSGSGARRRQRLRSRPQSAAVLRPGKSLRRHPHPEQAVREFERLETTPVVDAERPFVVRVYLQLDRAQLPLVEREGEQYGGRFTRVAAPLRRWFADQDAAVFRGSRLPVNAVQGHLS